TPAVLARALVAAQAALRADRILPAAHAPAASDAPHRTRAHMAANTACDRLAATLVVRPPAMDRSIARRSDLSVTPRQQRSRRHVPRPRCPTPPAPQACQ